MFGTGQPLALIFSLHPPWPFSETYRFGLIFLVPSQPSCCLTIQQSYRAGFAFSVFELVILTFLSPACYWVYVALFLLATLASSRPFVAI